MLHLIAEVPVFLSMVKQLVIVLLRNQFCAIAQENDAARAYTEATGTIVFHVILIWVLFELITDAGAAELSCSPR